MTKWRWGGIGVCGVIAVLAISHAGATTFWTCPYKPDLMASWVQAVGSFGAIIGAAALLFLQLRHSDSRLADDKRDERLALSRQLALLSSDACEMIDMLVALTSPADRRKHILDPIYAARVPAWRERIGMRNDDLLRGVANVLRSGAIELPDLEPVWKLQKLLHEVGYILAGIRDPGRQLDGEARGRIDEIARELKTIRFRTAGAYRSPLPASPST